MPKPDEIIAALKVLARVDRDDMVRLILAEQWPVPIRRRDSVRNMVGLALDHVSGQTTLAFEPPSRPRTTPCCAVNAKDSRAHDMARCWKFQ